MTTKKARILIIDDESAIKENLELFLEDENYEVFSVDSAEKGLELLNTGESFDLGIIDIRLPGMNGINFILEVCKMNLGMKFLIHTGSIDFQLNEELIRAGLNEDDIFRKPVVDIYSMIKRISDIL